MRAEIPHQAHSSYSRAAIELALLELGVICHVGPKEAVTRCIFHNDSSGGKNNLYINVKDKPGIFRCFVCNEKGAFESFVIAYTQWTMVRTLTFMRQCVRAVGQLDYQPAEKVKHVYASAEDRLAPYLFRHSYPASRGLLEETLLRFSIGYDRAENAITFPWFDRNGKLLAIKRRNVLSKFYSAEADTNTTSTLFGLHLSRQHAFLWITEGEFDAMFIDQCFRIANFNNHHALALGGTVLHQATIEQLLKRQPDGIVLLLDNDDAGREAQHKIYRQLVGCVRVYQPAYPTGVNDPNELNFEQAVQIVRSLTMKGD